MFDASCDLLGYIGIACEKKNLRQPNCVRGLSAVAGRFKLREHCAVYV